MYIKKLQLCLIITLFLSGIILGAIPASERAALIALYNSTNGDNWTDNYGWKTAPLDVDGFAMPGTEGGWNGVIVSDNKVTHIWERSNNNINGKIPPEIGNLTNLQYLKINNNQLKGNIPSELGSLSNLIWIDLGGNDLTGSIPSELGTLSNLTMLALNSNQLTGNIPPELGTLINLKRLSLSYNKLTGSIPLELGNLNKLTMLFLQFNKLTGEIPSNLTNLTNLISSTTDFSFNCLYATDLTLRAWLDTIDSDWELSQNQCGGTIPTISVTSPNGGEIWDVGSNKTITWTSTGTVGNVKIQYSTNNGSSWSTITSSTSNNGNYSWSIPVNPSTQCKVLVMETDGIPIDASNSVFTISNLKPTMTIDKSALIFRATTSGVISIPQSFFIDNIGTSTLNWVSTSDQSWLSCSPISGQNSGTVSVSVDPTGLTTGTYTGTIIITDPNASNSPQTVAVSLKVFNSNQTSVPFGQFATPVDGSDVSSSIAVTGWVLDDIGVESVKIYRGDINSLFYIGDAVLVEGARPDVEQAYPDYPMNYKAGWGYMMLTNFLPGGGNGTFNIHAIATDIEGNQTILGTKTIIVDNANAVKPFGAIDTPTQGGTATGSNFINWGWALTPQPNSIPTDGSTLSVIVDGVNLGHPTYDIYRVDIANLFPSYANSSGAVGYFYLDTTTYENGVHTIQWTAKDNAGNTDGIGSRYFTITNTASNKKGSVKGKKLKVESVKDLSNYEINKEPIELISDCNDKQLTTNDKRIIIKELERIVLNLNPDNSEREYIGYLKIGELLRRLPIGSTLKDGKFYWNPGPGFIGEYNFVFINEVNRIIKKIKIEISPKFGQIEKK